MKQTNSPHKQWCENCRQRVDETSMVKFPTVDTELQYQEFCQECGEKFTAWKRREISVYQLFDKTYKLNNGSK